MKANEIRRKLQPMADFAPAILAAAEIVEEAEKAEARLAELPKTKEKLVAEIAQLESRIAQRQQDASKFSKQAESLKPDSARLRELENREKAVSSREAEVAAREQKVAIREAKAKELADKIGSFTGLDA